MIASTKPRRLQPGDRVAIVSPSWGGPASFPQRYKAGVRALKEVLQVEVVEMAHTRADAQVLARNPQARADDLMRAFADPSVAAIIASIGGNDSIRLLPHLDLDLIRANPKIFLGFSDTTALHLACFSAGLRSFYGPSIMAGFAENDGMHGYTADGLRKALCSLAPIGTVARNEEGWTAEHLDWGDSALQHRKRAMQPPEPPLLLQGQGTASGHLLGGCAEVLEMAKATSWWPPLEQWQGAILFYETSEECPSPRLIRYWLRNFAAQGILARLSGMLLARCDPGGDPGYQQQVEQAVLEGLAEAGRADLPVLSRLDFGHTQPMLTLAYGAQASIDCASASLIIHDSATI